MIGPHETVFNESLSKLKINRENYFNGDTMTGNNEVKVYKAIEKGDFTITECFKDETEVRDNFNELWKILSNYNKYLALRSPTKNQVEDAALECEKFCKLFPTFFQPKT